MPNTNKYERILKMYIQLSSGEPLKKSKIIEKYNISEKTFQRDIESLNLFLVEQNREIIYNKKNKSYKLTDFSEDNLDFEKYLNSKEILAIIKILLESRAFPKNIMATLNKKLLNNCIDKENKDLIKSIIKNEEFYYKELRHGKNVLNILWKLSIAIKNNNLIEIDYTKINGLKVVRKIKPQAIMFSEFYFYIVGFLPEDMRANFAVKYDKFPTIYRVDRIDNIKIISDKYINKCSFKDKFEENKFRERIQFMQGGELQKIVFKFFGKSTEYIEDKIPTAIIKKEKDYYLVTAEVFGKGIYFWLNSQEDLIEIVEAK